MVGTDVDAPPNPVAEGGARPVPLVADDLTIGETVWLACADVAVEATVVNVTWGMTVFPPAGERRRAYGVPYATEVEALSSIVFEKLDRAARTHVAVPWQDPSVGGRYTGD